MTGQATTPTDFSALMQAIETSTIAASDLAVAALGQVRDGVITGEGPTAAGRVHFSRTLDQIDAALCGRILLAAGGTTGAPVTRAEADMLLAIDAAAAERDDAGIFDDLLVKAVAHHVMSAAGRPVPPRAIALDAATPLESWAGVSAHADRDVLEWIGGHVRGTRRSSRALMTLAAFVIGAATPLAQSLASFVDVSL